MRLPSAAELAAEELPAENLAQAGDGLFYLGQEEVTLCGTESGFLLP